MDDIGGLRRTYRRGTLDLDAAVSELFAQFEDWLNEALHADGIVEPNAMTVATVDAAGRPSARVVLLRQWDARGFVFYTNYESRKAADLRAHPYGALLFWWGPLERQVRIEGKVERVGATESDGYFATRPRGHRLSAWASRQSEAVPDRASLERAMAQAEARFPGDVPRPPFWGGFRVVPDRMEFWQGRPNRVHDRILYERIDERWSASRLSP